MEEHQTNQDIIDITDCRPRCLSGMKNFCFWLDAVADTAAGLFWLSRRRIAYEQRCGTSASCRAICPALSAPESAPAAAEAQPSDAAPAVPAAAAAPAAAPAAPAENPQAPASVPSEPIAQAAQEVAQEAQPAAEPEKTKSASLKWPLFHLSCRHAWVLISGLNAVLLFAAVLYCLVLLITLKVSLVSRLGGINHISRALFISLFLLIFLFPWQCLIPGVLVGAIYLPSELLCVFPSRADGSKFWLVLTYLRFVGLWILAAWLLVWSAIAPASGARHPAKAGYCHPIGRVRVGRYTKTIALSAPAWVLRWPPTFCGAVFRSSCTIEPNQRPNHCWTAEPSGQTPPPRPHGRRKCSSPACRIPRTFSRSCWANRASLKAAGKG